MLEQQERELPRVGAEACWNTSSPKHPRLHLESHLNLCTVCALPHTGLDGR